MFCFLGGSGGKESACNAGGPDSILGLGRAPGEGNCNPLQYSCLENSNGQRSLKGFKDSDTTEQVKLTNLLFVTFFFLFDLPARFSESSLPYKNHTQVHGSESAES